MTQGWRIHHTSELLQPQTQDSTPLPTQTLLTFTMKTKSSKVISPQSLDPSCKLSCFWKGGYCLGASSGRLKYCLLSELCSLHCRITVSQHVRKFYLSLLSSNAREDTDKKNNLVSAKRDSKSEIKRGTITIILSP